MIAVTRRSIDDIEIAEQLGRSSGWPLTASIRQFVPHSYQKPHEPGPCGAHFAVGSGEERKMRTSCWTGLILSTLMMASAGPGVTAASSTPAPGGQSVPKTLTEQDYTGLMKKVGPTYQSLQKKLESGATADAAKDAQQLAELFGSVERFWAQHKKADAVKWAQQARTYASDAAGAATTGDADKALAAANNMRGMCKQCHGTYREGDAATGFRIKPSALTAP
jgi:cytochrome c556